MKRIDSLTVVQIRKNAWKLIKVNTEIRYGQAIYCAAYDECPELVEKLRNTKYDCYYDDDRVTEFLEQLIVLYDEETKRKTKTH